MYYEEQNNPYVILYLKCMSNERSISWMGQMASQHPVSG